MSETGLVVFSGLMFTLIIFMLVFFILIAKSKLVASGNVKISINDNPKFSFKAAAGDKLMNVLAYNKIFLASACGGRGTCGQCKVIVSKGGGDVLATEKTKLDNKHVREGYRLSCQVPVKNDL